MERIGYSNQRELLMSHAPTYGNAQTGRDAITYFVTSERIALPVQLDARAIEFVNETQILVRSITYYRFIIIIIVISLYF
jgi:hypothetical protein